MGLLDQLSDVLQQYSGGAAAGQAPADVHQHFDQVAQAAPSNVLADGIAAAFHSNSTPDFSQMLGGLFNQSNGEQKAGILNQLVSSAGPSVLASLAGGGALAGLLGGAKGPITADQAAQVSPEAVQQLAAHAQSADPSIIDKASAFYAQHPGLVKTLGSAALTIALAKVAQSTKG